MSVGDMLQAERDAEDAARYRWLKEHVTDVFLAQEVALFRDTHRIYVRLVTGSDLDEATDYGRRAVRSAGEVHGQKG